MIPAAQRLIFAADSRHCGIPWPTLSPSNLQRRTECHRASVPSTRAATHCKRPVLGEISRLSMNYDVKHRFTEKKKQLPNLDLTHWQMMVSQVIWIPQVIIQWPFTVLNQPYLWGPMGSPNMAWEITQMNHFSHHQHSLLAWGCPWCRPARLRLEIHAPPNLGSTWVASCSIDSHKVAMEFYHHTYLRWKLSTYTTIYNHIHTYLKKKRFVKCCIFANK